MEVCVFLSAAAEDVEHRDALVRQLAPLEKAGRIRLWHEGLVARGADRRAVAWQELARSSMVLLLVSADFLASDACAEVVTRSLERAGRGDVRVVPILLRPCLMGRERIAKLASLPADGRPVTLWPDRDEAWTKVAEGIDALLGDRSIAADIPQNRASAERTRILESLEDARVRRRLLAERGVATSDLDEQILALKRDLREAGQLHQGDILGDRYLLLRKLGRGGFGTVWEAEDRDQPARVAVKVLHADMAGDETRRARFFRGARVMSELRHEAIVRVLAPEEQDGGFHYFVMELMAGGDLGTAVTAGKVPEERVVPLILRVGEALSVAHEHAHGFIHRDVKPANILLDEPGNPKLSDFDLVAGKDTTGGTGTGAMGSFVYAAPEMLSRPQDADQRADVFSLGMTALFCLHGQPLTEEAFFEPQPLLEALGRPEIAKVLAKAIQRKAANRYDSVRAFCDALSEADAAERGIKASPPVSNEVHHAPTILEEEHRSGSATNRSMGEALRAMRALEVAAHNEVKAMRTAEDAPRPADPKDAVRTETKPDQQSVFLRKLTSRQVVDIVGYSIVIAIGSTAAAYGIGRYGSGSRKEGDDPLAAVRAAASAVQRTSPGADPASSDEPTAAATSEPPPSDAPAPTAPVVCPADPKMMLIAPKGLKQEWHARIGSAPGEGADDEHPRWQATLKPYCMHKTEVTVADYYQCVQKKKCTIPSVNGVVCNGAYADRKQHPVNCVLLKQAWDYCVTLGARLPTEAEWEFAARGPEERLYPWGEQDPTDIACWSPPSGSPRGSTCAVATRGDNRSPFGIYDMAGSVLEWTKTVYYPYNHSSSATPPFSIVRGGHWGSVNATQLRGAARGSLDANAATGPHVGFRCVRDL